MIVTPTTMTVAEFCQQYTEGLIVIDRSYQRSPNWPVAARSFLIDTILKGYPIPKLCLAESTDLKTRKTTKAVIDGQQRTRAILEFFEDDLRISTRTSEFYNKKFSHLTDEDQHRFLEYRIGIDVFTGATEEDIRELFRRINWYTAPLNAQEKRHAQYAGEFKQFIAQIAHEFGTVLSDYGTFGPNQLSRMADAAFFAECIYTYLKGVDHASVQKINKMYSEFDEEFSERQDCYELFSETFRALSQWDSIRRTNVSKVYNLYSLLTAVMHCLRPSPALQDFPSDPIRDRNHVEDRLHRMDRALDSGAPPEDLKLFVEACSKATNRKRQRTIRLKYFIAAITGAELWSVRRSIEGDAS